MLGLGEDHSMGENFVRAGECDPTTAESTNELGIKTVFLESFIQRTPDNI